MQLVDARRLTGPNLLSRRPLVIVELTLDPGETLDRAHALYVRELGRMRAALGFSREIATIVRPHLGGGVLAYESQIDEMLACAEMSEWAALGAAAVLAGGEPLALEPKRAEIEAILARDRNPRLLALAAEAARRGVPFAWDDEQASLGMGKRSRTFAVGDAPAVGDVAWESVGPIPVALVTGTNGKTTSTRLLARVALEAGLVVGATSTDAITIGGKTLDEGDWTGPAAARTVLRNPAVEIAILETARGGILRRGLAVEACDAALITNVSDDHLGLYGIDDLPAMTRVKGVVADVVRETGTFVTNAADPNLVAFARARGGKIAYFADLDAGGDTARAVVRAHRAAGGEAVFTRDGAIVCARGDVETSLARASDAPITFGGAARYNVENVLGVVATARALGLPDDAILRALRGFGMRDNPRRGELVEARGVRVLLDFGHNPEAVRAALRLVAELRKAKPGRLTVVTGSAGDRSDREIDDIARAVCEVRPDRVLVRELADYLRGRAPGVVPELLRGSFAAHGLPAAAFALVGSEVDALRVAFDGARDGDVIALLVHLDHDEVHAFLETQI